MKIKLVVALSGYRLKLLFEDDIIRIVECDKDNWNNFVSFKRVQLSDDGYLVTWPNGLKYSVKHLLESAYEVAKVEEETLPEESEIEFETGKTPEERLEERDNDS